MQVLRSKRLAFALADATFRFTVGRPERATTDSAVFDETATEPPPFPRFWAGREHKKSNMERQHSTTRPSCVPSVPSDPDNAAVSAPEQDDQVAQGSLVAPLTPLPGRAPPRDPTICAPKQCSSLQQPRFNDSEHAPTKTRKRARQKTQRRREQCRINQARYRAKLKRRRLEALVGGASSNDENCSSSLNGPSVAPPGPKKPRTRVKTARRMQQCRINQARYRNKQRARELDLEKTIERLRVQIQQLERRRLQLVEQGSRLDLQGQPAPPCVCT